MYNMNRSWIINSTIPNLISFSMSYLENEYVLKNHFKISDNSFDFSSLSILQQLFKKKKTLFITGGMGI